MMKIQILVKVIIQTQINQNDDDADEKNDFNNFGDEKRMMKKTLIKTGQGSKSDDDKDERRRKQR